MNCFTRKTLVGANRVRVNLSRLKPIVLRVKHWINDPFGHKLQITLINVTTFYA